MMQNKLYLGVLLSLVLLSGYVYAFAISSAFTTSHPLEISQGESSDIVLTMQNMAGNENMTVRASLSEGSDIAQIVNPSDKYDIPLGTMKDITIKVTIPANAALGNHNIKVSFTTVKESTSGGGAGIGSGIDQNILVLVKGKQAAPATVKPSYTWLYLTIGIIIIIIVIIIIIRRKR